MRLEHEEAQALRTCDWQKRMQDLLDGGLPDEVLKRFVDHLETCSECRREWEKWQDLRRALRGQAAPAWDRDALRTRLFSSSGPRTATWVPALGLVGLSLLLVVLAIWPVPPEPETFSPEPKTIEAVFPKAVFPKAVFPKAVSPVPEVEAVLVTWLSGSAEQALSMSSGRVEMLEAGELRLAEDGEAALRLGDAISVCAFADSHLKIQQQARSWRIQLERGRLMARLQKDRKRSFTVEVPAGTVTAVGTVFSVERTPLGGARVNLREGQLQLRASCGQLFELRAPIAVTLTSCSLDDVAELDPKAQAMLQRAEQLDPMGQAPVAWVGLNSDPEGAEVFASGKGIGHTPLWVARAEGSWDLELRKSGHKSRQTSLRFASGELQRVSIQLEPLTKIAMKVSQPEDLMARARSLLAQRNVVEARSVLARHLALQPGDWQARLLDADALRLSGDAQAAVRAYLIIARDQETPERSAEAAFFEVARLQLRVLKQPEAALRSFRDLRRAQPDGLLRQEVAFGLAESYLLLKEFGRAVRAFEDYLRLFPEGTRAKQARALLLELEEKGWR
ncbi:MAG: FecR domain-containing protein [Deltaproteobacteria bacterium]|nr:FecR domain-containing protein [Deltaproteobacteria bacterium]